LMAETSGNGTVLCEVCILLVNTSIILVWKVVCHW
jgi:hypothetical protein